MSTTNRVIRNSLLNLAAGAGQRAGHTIIFILIARSLSVEQTGAYTLANTYTNVLLAFSLWGLDQLLVREVARNREIVTRFLGGFLVLRLLMSTLLWIGLALIIQVLSYSSESKQLILLMSLTIIPGSIANLYQSVWIAFEDVRAISITTLLVSLFRLAGGAGLLWYSRPLKEIAYLFIFASLAETAVVVWLTHRRHVLVKLRRLVDLPFWLDSLRTATPLIIVTLVLIVEYQFDVVILSLYWPEATVAVYAAAALFLTALLFLTRSYQLAIFPVLSRAYQDSAAYLQRIYSRSMAYLVAGAIIIAIVVSLLSEPIIELIYGAGYVQAGTMVRILVWAFVFSAFNVPNSRLMIVANQQRLMVLFAIASLSGNLLLNAWLVPRFGGVGSAWARVLAMPLYSIPAFLYVQRNICKLDLRGQLGRNQ